MEFIRRFHDTDDLASVRDLLREKGIPTHVAPGGGRTPAFWSLFCCINEQAEDARRLLHDPMHTPVLRVDAEEFERALSQPVGELLTKWATVIGAVVLVCFIVLVCLLHYLRA
jgi:hypothetical protein